MVSFVNAIHNLNIKGRRNGKCRVLPFDDCILPQI